MMAAGVGLALSSCLPGSDVAGEGTLLPPEDHAPARIRDGPFLEPPSGILLADPGDAGEAVLGGGAIWVAFPGEERVHRYDSAGGAPEGSVGRRGEGPGEFLSLSGIGWMGDTLALADRLAAAVHLFAADGSYLELRRWTAAEAIHEPPFLFSPSNPDELHPLRGGRAWARPGMAMLAPPEPLGGRVATSTLRVPILVLGPSPGNARVVHHLEEEHASVLERRGAEQFMVLSPFSRRDLAVVLPDGGGFVHLRQEPGGPRSPARFDLTWYGPEGEGVEPIAYRLRASAWTDEELRWEAARARVAAPPGSALAPDEVLGVLRGAGLLPRYAHPVLALRADQSRRVWVRLRQGADPPEWIALREDGSVALRLRDPTVAEVLGGRDDLLVVLREVAAGEFRPQVIGVEGSGEGASNGVG